VNTDDALKLSNTIQLLEMFGEENIRFTEGNIHRKATNLDLMHNYTERGGSSGHRMRMDASHQLPFLR